METQIERTIEFRRVLESLLLRAKGDPVDSIKVTAS
jgi:hypothetical protein